LRIAVNTGLQCATIAAVWKLGHARSLKRFGSELVAEIYMKIPFVDLKAQYDSIRADIDTAIANVINETAFIKSPYIAEFEKAFAAFIGIRNCIGCANGTDAIEIALRALEIGPGDEVIVPANTWISTAEAVTTAGAKVVFVDNHPELYTIDVSKIEEKISSRTKAIIQVHLYGLPAEMDTVMSLARSYNLKVIEDCAQCHGAKYKGQTTGTFGDIATFSFFPGKNLGAYGDAGGIVTNNDDLAKFCRMIGDHGRLGKYDHGLEGRNSRLDGLQAAILSAKLPYLSEWTSARQQHAATYDNLLSSLDIQRPFCPDKLTHVYHLYVVQVPDREKLQERLAEKGIATGIHYPIALPLLSAYKYLNHQASDFPVAARGMSRILSLPMYAELSTEKIEYVVENLGRALSGS
jgi:dTDP-4-amino-4,6-dideoxygalactose transaminase